MTAQPIKKAPKSESIDAPNLRIPLWPGKPAFGRPARQALPARVLKTNPVTGEPIKTAKIMGNFMNEFEKRARFQAAFRETIAALAEREAGEMEKKAINWAKPVSALAGLGRRLGGEAGSFRGSLSRASGLAEQALNGLKPDWRAAGAAMKSHIGQYPGRYAGAAGALGGMGAEMGVRGIEDHFKRNRMREDLANMGFGDRLGLAFKLMTNPEGVGNQFADQI